MDKLIWAIGLALALSICGSAFADEKQQITECAAKGGDAARLTCYDDLARSLGVDRPRVRTTRGRGKWRVREERSPIDDSLNVTLALQSEESVRSGYNTVQPALFVRCKENRTNVFINWDLYLGIDSTRMLTRFDREQAVTDSWSISTNHNAVFARNHIAFARKMMGHDELLAQITPYGENSVMAEFDIRGLSEAITTLRQSCSW